MQAIVISPIGPRASRRGGRTSARRTSAGRTTAARKEAARRRLTVLTRLMDGLFEVPGTKFRIGLDPLIGLVPVAGDIVPALIGLYLVYEARQLGASRWLQAKMVGNLLLDMAGGAVPMVGDFFDVMFRAHHRNLKLLQQELGEPFIDGR